MKNLRKISLLSVICFSIAATAAPLAISEQLNLITQVDNVAPNVSKWEIFDGMISLQNSSITPDIGGVIVTKCAIVCDDNDDSDILTVTAVVKNPSGTIKESETLHEANPSEETDCHLTEVDPTFNSALCNLYTGNFGFASTDAPGNYEVNVTATDKGNLSAAGINNLNFGSCTAIEIDNFTIDFGKLLPGGQGQDTIAIRNACNTPIDMQEIVTELVGLSLHGSISSGNIAETLGSTQPTNGCFNINLTASQSASMTSILSVPLGTLPDAYAGNKTLTAVPVNTCD